MPSSNSDFRFGPPGAGRVYRPSRAAQIASVIPAGAALAFAAFFLFGPMPAAGRPIGVVFSLAMALLTAGLALSAWRSAVVLLPDRVEVRGLFGSRAMAKADIAGYRPLQRRNGPAALRLESRTPGVRPLIVSRFQSDQAFEAWFEGVADLNAADLARSKAELLADPALGATEAERVERLGQMRTLVVVYSAACLVVGGWILIAPQLQWPALGLALALPPLMIALAAWSGGALSIISGRTDARPKLFAGLILGAVLAMRALGGPPTLDAGRAALFGLGVAVVLTLGVLAADPKARRSVRQVLVIALALLAFGYGAAIGVNRLADHAQSSLFQTVVMDKWVSRGRSTSWNLKLAPWGPLQRSTTLDVNSAAYDQIAVGQTLCLGLHAGALGLRWYQRESCPASMGAASALRGAGLGAAMAQFYPDAALRAGAGGQVRFTCKVAADGRLVDCAIVSESPVGLGFGAATLRVAKLIHVQPQTRDGKPTVGRDYSRLVIWKVPQ